MIAVEADNLDTEGLALKAIDAGAEDVSVENNYVEIYTKPEDFEAVRAALEKEAIPIASAEVTMLPKTTVELEEKPALQTLRLLHKLEEIDGVQHVASNVNFSDAILGQFQE